MRTVLLAAAIASVHTPTLAGGQTAFPVIDAYGGRVVWSDYDASGQAWRLMESTDGATRAVPVAPRSSPFDLDLGPDGRGGTLAVYSRCRRSLPANRPTPELQTDGLYGCDLYAYSFTTGRERAVGRANSRADESWPAVWGGRIAFVRTYKRKRDRFHRLVPYVYWRERSRGGATTHRVRLPATPRRQTRLVDSLDMRRRTVGYIWRGVDEFSTYSFVFRNRLGRRPHPVGRGASFGGGAADSLKRVGDLALGAGRADWLFQDLGEPRYRAAFLRKRSRQRLEASTPTSRAVAFAADDLALYWVDAGAFSGNDPAFQPGGTFALMSTPRGATRYRTVPRSWLTIEAPR